MDGGVLWTLAPSDSINLQETDEPVHMYFKERYPPIDQADKLDG